MDTINERLQQLRESLKMNVSEFARHVGIDRSRYAKMESGPNKPAMDAVEAIAARIPELELRWLLTGAGPMLRDGRALSPAPVAAAVAPAPYLSHTNLSPEEIGKLLMKVAALEARAEAAEREAAKYWTVVERYAGKKTEGNRLPAAAEPEAVYTTPERTPVGYKVGKSTDATECKVIQLVPAEESVSVTPSYVALQKAL